MQIPPRKNVSEGGIAFFVMVILSVMRFGPGFDVSPVEIQFSTWVKRNG